MANNPLRFPSHLFGGTLRITHEEAKGGAGNVWLRRLSPSVSLDLSRCSSQSGFAPNEITAAVLAFWNVSRLWMGRSPPVCSREIQFKICTAHCRTLLLFKRMCVCVCKVCKGDTNTQYNLIKSNFDSASTAHPFKHVSAGLPVMSSKLLKLYSRLQNWTSLLHKAHNAYTHTGHTQRARSGAVWGLWWNR